MLLLPPAISYGIAVAGIAASVLMGSMGVGNITHSNPTEITNPAVISKYDQEVTPWVHGRYKNFDFDAKVYDQPSQFGINNGRVSKFTVYDKDRTWIINYDRGWDVVPDTPEEKQMVKDILDKLENLKPMDKRAN